MPPPILIRVKDIKVAEIVKQIKLKETWGESVLKKWFQRQSKNLCLAFYVFVDSSSC